MPTIIEVLRAASGGGEDSGAAIQMLETHRRGLARTFLDSTDSAEALNAKIPDLAVLAANAFPWDPNPEDYELASRILEQWDCKPAPPPNVLMAAMTLAPAHHFPAPPRLRDVPAWLRLHYANYLFGRPHLFLHAGESERYAAHGARAMSAVCTAVFEDRLPDSLDIARLVARVDSAMIYFNEQSLKAFFRDKARITEWMMLNQRHLLGHGFPLVRRERPRIGILHRSLAPGTETYHLLGHLLGRDRDAAEVRIYMLDSGESSLRETFETWADELVQLQGDVGAAVASMRDDDLDLCFISNNIAWGLTIETAIAAHRLARVQVVSGASPCSAGFSASDLFLTSATNDPTPNAQDDYQERLAFVPGAVGAFGFALDPDPRTIECTRETLGVSADEVVFFSGANYYKLTPDLLITWAEILARVPNSRLVLMPFNPNWGPAYPVTLFLNRVHRELIRLGVPINRVRPIARVPTRADLHAVMSLADVYLDSFPYSGACSLVDPLVVGLPIVGRAGTRLRTAQGGSLLRAEGLHSAVCADAEAYIERAVRLAEDPAYREREADLVRRASASGLACLDTEPFAQRFFAFCAEAVRAAHDRLDAQRRSSPKALQRDIQQAATAAFGQPTPAFLRLHDVELARQLLVPWLSTLAAEGAAAGRVIDVGACTGTVATPFLAAGFRVEMFEPDPECAPRMRELVAQYSALAVHWSSAVVAEPAAEVSFNKRGVGLSGLGDSPYGAAIAIRVPATTLGDYLRQHPGDVDLIKIDAEGSDLDILCGLDLADGGPKAIMVEFGMEFPGQSAAKVGEAIAAMEQHGYGAVVFEYQRLAGFGVDNWDHELVDIAFDVKRLTTRGDGFGNILFHRQGDTVFLTCLAQLLESYGPASTRPTFANARAPAFSPAAADSSAG